jgi:hypothetical protein
MFLMKITEVNINAVGNVACDERDISYNFTVKLEHPTQI